MKRLCRYYTDARTGSVHERQCAHARLGKLLTGMPTMRPIGFYYLTGVVYWLVAHYLGRKHRCSIPQVMRTSYGVDPTSGKRALYTSKGGKRVYIWNKPPQRQSIVQRGGGRQRCSACPDDWMGKRSEL